MSWQQVIETYNIKFNKRIVNCHLTHERDFIINTILTEFPGYNKNIVAAAVLHCCRMISDPKSRDLFFEMVERIITNHMNAENKT